MDADTPRARALGMLKLERGMDVDAIAALCDGGRFAPDPLSEGERAALTSRSLADAPAHVAGDYPEWLDGYLAQVFGDERVAEATAMASRAPLDLRVNTLKAKREKVLGSTHHLGTTPTPWSPIGLRIALGADARNPGIHAEEDFIKGAIEVQDEGSQLAALLSNAKPGEQVIDLCAGAGAEVDHLLAGFCIREQRRQLRALVLDLDGAFDEILLGMNAGVAGVGAERNAQADRRPWRRPGAEMRGGSQHLFAFGLQGIDAQIERRAAGHRGRLGHAFIAEHLREVAVEPFRVIAGDMRRRIGQRPRRQCCALAVAQGRRRKPAAVAERGDCLDIHAALELEHAERARARGVGVHDPGAGGAAAQHVPDQAGDRGAVARAGIAVRGAPFLQRFRRRDALGVDGLDQFDSGGEPRGGCHSKLSLENGVRSAAGSAARSTATSRTAPAPQKTTPASGAGRCWRSRKYRHAQSG